MIKISVIIPIYNAEKYLRKCLNSIILQTYKNLEIICINDGSTDSSKEILEEYAQNDDRIKIINQENGGLSHARNIGMELATGDYFTFIDSDDWLQLGTYQKFVDIVKKEERIIDIFVFNGILHYDHDLNSPVFINLFPAEVWGNLLDPIKKYKDAINPVDSSISVWNKLFRKEWYDNHKIKFMDRMLAQDRLFSVQSYFLADNIYILNDYLYCYQQLKGSLSNKLNKNVFNVITICNEIKKTFIENNYYNENKSYIFNLFLGECLIALQKCPIEYSEEFLNEVRKNIKEYINDLGMNYFTDKNFKKSEDFLKLSYNELKEKYKSSF